MAATDDIHGLIGRLGEGFGTYRRFEAPPVPVPQAAPPRSALTLDALLDRHPLAPARRGRTAPPRAALGPGMPCGADHRPGPPTGNPPLAELFERLCRAAPGHAPHGDGDGRG